jgi:hypothetical protein
MNDDKKSDIIVRLLDAREIAPELTELLEEAAEEIFERRSFIHLVTAVETLQIFWAKNSRKELRGMRSYFKWLSKIHQDVINNETWNEGHSDFQERVDAVRKGLT